MIYGRPVGGAGGGATVEYVDYGGDGEIIQHATFSHWSNGIADQKAANAGEYLLFAGGRQTTSYTVTNYVLAYDTSITQTTLTSLTNYVYMHASASVGGNAIFAGGSNGSTNYNTVDAYSASLAKTTPTALSFSSGYGLAGACGKNHALISGGANAGAVNAYDASLTRTVPASGATLAVGAMGGAAGDYVIFAANAAVNAYDGSLALHTPEALSTSRVLGCAVSIGEYVVFAGGGLLFGAAGSTAVDAYDASLTRSTPAQLPTGLGNTSGATLAGSYALVGGGNSSTTNPGSSRAVFAYDKNLTLSTLDQLGYSCTAGICAGSIGNRVMFCGGRDTSGTNYAMIAGSGQTYELPTLDVIVPDQCKYAFGGGEEATASGKVTLSLIPPVNGYIKYTNTTIS